MPQVVLGIREFTLVLQVPCQKVQHGTVFQNCRSVYLDIKKRSSVHWLSRLCKKEDL